MPTGHSAYHAQRFHRNAEGAVYLLAWRDDLAVGHVLVTPVSKYELVRARLGTFPEVNALGVAAGFWSGDSARTVIFGGLAGDLTRIALAWSSLRR